MIQYKAGGIYANVVTEVEITRETESSVWTNEHGRERRHAKASEWGHYFESEKQAYEYILGVCLEKETEAQRKLDRVKKEREAAQKKLEELS